MATMHHPLLNFFYQPRKLWFTGIVVLALFMISTALLTYQKEIAKAEVIAEETAHTFALITEYLLNDGERMLTHAAGNYLRDPSEHHAQLTQALLQARKATTPHVMDLLILGADGKILLWSNETNEKPDVRQRSYYQHHLNTPSSLLHVTPPQLSLVYENKWFFSLSLAIRDDSGELLGVGVMIVSIPELQRLYSSLLPQGNLSAALIYRSGQLVVRAPHLPVETGTDLSTLIHLPADNQAQTLLYEKALDGERRMVFFFPLEKHGMIVAGTVNLNDSLNLWRIGVAALALFWLIIALLGYIFVQHLHQALEAKKNADTAFMNTLQNLTKNLPGFVYQIRIGADNTVAFNYASDGVQKILGLSAEEVTSEQQRVLKLIHPEDYQRVIDETVASARALSPWHGEFRAYDMSGRMLWLEARDTPQAQADGSVLLIGYANDVTHRIQIEEALRQSEATFRAYVESANDIIYALDFEGRLTYVSPNWTENLGYPVEEVLNTHIERFVHPDDLPRCIEFLQKILRSGKKDGGIEYRVRHQDGHWCWHTSNASPLMDKDGRVSSYLGIARDISERKLSEERITHLAHYDTLTDLPNRTLFNELVHQAIGHAKREQALLALLFIDLDEFKPVNDQYGHAIGDILLQDVADRMRNTLRDEDSVARLGGDEFVILLPAIKHPDDALTTADKLLAQLRQVFVIEDIQLRISASIGIAIYPQHAQTPDELMRMADHAMYFAKQSGRNQAQLFHKQMTMEL